MEQSSDGPRSRRSPRDRRRRLHLALETIVPVILRSEVGVQWALARNVSEGGMLIELETAPPIGSRVEIKLFGVRGSLDAPEHAWIGAEVRHHLAWNFEGQGRKPGLTAVAVRFVDEPVFGARRGVSELS